MPSPPESRARRTSRETIAERVRALRTARHWTQAQLAQRLSLSQSRLSEIESGDGSFTAEQFLVILKLFNVPVSHFSTGTRDRTADLQNALARLGAHHLQESEDVLPTERFEDVATVVRETLADGGSPRLITALAPVLVLHADRINLKRVHAELVESGLERRLAWLAENTLEAIRKELRHAPPSPLGRAYRRAEVVLNTFLEFLHAAAGASRARKPKDFAPDILDAGIRSKKTVEELKASSSLISRRWGIVTALKIEDFSESLRASYVDHSRLPARR